MDEFSDMQRLFCRVYGGVRVVFVSAGRDEGLNAAAEALTSLAEGNQAGEGAEVEE